MKDVLSSGAYMPKVTEAMIDSQDFRSPVVRLVKTETDKSLADKSKGEERCSWYLERAHSLKSN